MSIDRNNNNLERFRYSCPAWWEGFNAGRRSQRRSAQQDGATWEFADWQRGAAAEIEEGEVA